jgi:hypothetical protein
MEALLARTAQTLRGRFEALRPGGAIPVLMAETPRGHPLPLRSDSGPRLPIFEWKYQSTPRWVCGAMVTLDRQHVANRDVWLGVELNVGQSIRRVCREAASFVPFIRRHCGLPEECGTDDLESVWIWTVLELAAVGVPGSLLKLDGRGVFRCAGSIVRATECDLSRAASIPPTADDLVSQSLRMDFDPTRYWQLEDLVEASIQVMDVVEVAIAGLASLHKGADGNPAISPPGSGGEASQGGKRKRRPRGEPTAELLRQLWNTTEGKSKILAAGSAEKIGMVIGKSATAVKEAGPIWDKKILPALEAHRSLVRLHREEERLDG